MTLLKLFNSSSESMKEIMSKSIDLVITDPPFNIGCFFGREVDDSFHEDYLTKIGRVVSEIGRVLDEKGTAVFLVPAVVKRGSQLYEYPNIYSGLCKEVGLTPIEFCVEGGLSEIGPFQYKVTEENYDCAPERELRESHLDRNAHSEEIHGLVFAKGRQLRQAFPKDKIYKYVPAEGHPCPYPPELVDNLLDTFFEPYDIFSANPLVVLDPFMGTGRLGREVLRRGGKFVGYEVEKGIYETAREKLIRAEKKILKESR